MTVCDRVPTNLRRGVKFSTAATIEPGVALAGMVAGIDAIRPRTPGAAVANGNVALVPPTGIEPVSSA